MSISDDLIMKPLGGRWVSPDGGDTMLWQNDWSPDLTGAPDVTDPANYTQRLGKDVLNAITNFGSYGVGGQAGVGGGNMGIDAAGNRVPYYSRIMGDQGRPDEIQLYMPGHGPGEDFYRYDSSGNFLGVKKGAKTMSHLQGIAQVIGAALSFGALGAATAGAGTAAGAGATAAETAAIAGEGISYAANGSPIFGVVDQGVIAGQGITYGAGGSPIFGVVDTSAIAGPGISYTSAGSPVFGVVDTSMIPGEAAAGAGGAGGAGAGGGGGGGGGTGSGGGTTGGGAGTGAGAKAAEKLGISKVVDALGDQLISAGVSSLVGGLGGGKSDLQPPTLPNTARAAESKTKAVSAMPDPLAQQRARKRSIVEQLGRRGRASTIMTAPSGRLGG